MSRIFDKYDVYCNGNLVLVKTYNVHIGINGLGTTRFLSNFFENWVNDRNIDPMLLTEEDIEVFKFDLTLYIESAELYGTEKEKYKLLSVSS